MKQCCHCKQEKPLAEFHNDRTQKDGKCRQCKLCKAKYSPTYYRRMEKLAAGYKRCKQCDKAKEVKDFHKDRTKQDGYYSICKVCRAGRIGYKPRQKKPVDSSGYIKKGPARLHRLIMENILGRKLERWEHVHHINGIKTDNRPENLTVLSDSEHHSIHSREIAERRKNGQTFVCNSCGAEKYYPLGTILKNAASIEHFASKYLCRSCYYKSKRWLQGMTVEKLRNAQKLATISRLRNRLVVCE